MTTASKTTQPTSHTSLGSQPWSSATSAFLWTSTLKSVITESSENMCAQYVSVICPLRCHPLPRLYYRGVDHLSSQHSVDRQNPAPVDGSFKIHSTIFKTIHTLFYRFDHPNQYNNICCVKNRSTVPTCVLGANHVRSGHSEVNNRSTRWPHPGARDSTGLVERQQYLLQASFVEAHFKMHQVYI